MPLTCFIVWKSWASNPLRLALAVLGVALGVAVVCAIHVIDHNTIQSRVRQMRPDFGRVDFELVPLDREQALSGVLEELRGDPDLGAVGVLRSANVGVRAGPRSIQGRVFGLGPLPSLDFAHYLIAEGEDLEPGADDGVLLGAAMASFLQVRPGDQLELSPPQLQVGSVCRNGERVAMEAGATPPPSRTVTVRGVLQPTGLARQNAGMSLVAAYELVGELAPDTLSVFQVNRTPGVQVDRLRRRLAERFQVRDERSALLGEAADERAFRNGVKILGCLALILGMFVVFQTLSQTLVEQVRRIGILRCLGTSRRVLLAAFTLDATGTALLGSGLGVGLGIGLAWVLKSLRFTTLGLGKTIEGFELPVQPLLWTALLGTLFTLAGALFPLFRLSRLPALRILNARGLVGSGGSADRDVLRGVNGFLFLLLVGVLPAAYLAMTPLLGASERETLVVLLQAAGLLATFGAILLLAPGFTRLIGGALLGLCGLVSPLPSFLVGSSLRRSSGRFAASVCGLGVVLVAFVALKAITRSLEAEVRQFADRSTRSQVFLSSERPHPRTAVAELGDISGIARVSWLEGSVSAPILLSGLDSRFLEWRDGVLEPHPDQAASYRESRGLVVSERLAWLEGLAPGDAVSLLTDQGPVAYTVLAVSDRAGFFPDERAWAVCDPRWLRQDFCVGSPSVQRLTVTLDPGADPNGVLARIRDRLPDFAWAKTGAELEAYALRDVTRDFLFFDVLLVLILLLASVGLLNGMTIAAASRVREIGVLRALGMSDRQLRGTFLVEGMVVAALATVLATALGLPMGYLVVEGLNRVAGLQAPFAPPWASVAAVPLMAFVVALLAAVLPGMRAVRASPATAVRYE